MRWGQKREKRKKNSFHRSRAGGSCAWSRWMLGLEWRRHTGCGNSAASSIAPHSLLARGLGGKKEERQQARPTNGEFHTGLNRKHGRSDPSSPLVYQILAVKTLGNKSHTLFFPTSEGRCLLQHLSNSNHLRGHRTIYSYPHPLLSQDRCQRENVPGREQTWGLTSGPGL